MCGCVWRYEASALFLGQLLVTQEWLICNGCCHSPAVAPGDGCAVTNAHALTCSLWRRHTEVQNIHKSVRFHARSLACVESCSFGGGFFINTHFSICIESCVFPHLPVNEAVDSISSSRFCLQSTVVVEKSIQDLMNLMQDLSAYSNQFLEMVCDKLKEYKDICNTAYR